MVSLQSTFTVKICETLQIVERLFSLTTLWKVIKVADQTFKNGFSSSIFFINFLCWHCLNIFQSFYLCLSVIWYKILSHFSLSSSVFPLQLVHLHWKELIMAFILGFSSSKRFCLHRVASFFSIFIATC